MLRVDDLSLRLAACIFFIPAITLTFLYRSRQGTARGPRLTPTTDDTKDCKFGSKFNAGFLYPALTARFEAWKPIKFTYPPITPCHVNPLKIHPIPYRPFRAGEYQSVP